MNYTNYTQEDFVNDEHFQNWVFKPGVEDVSAFWNAFIAQHPEKKEEIEKAKEALEAIPFHKEFRALEPSGERIRESFLQVSKILKLKGRNKARLFSLSIGKWAAAASVFLFLSLGYIFLKNEKQQALTIRTASSKPDQDIAPGGNKAILTLGNGQKMILDSVGNGTLSIQGNSVLTKLADGQIAYKGANNSPDQEIVYNTISTPAGGQYNITLSDGSRIWLNSSSSLKFPASFLGNERRVELTGEGYFEVAALKGMPFSVSVNNSVIEVLGTHFNINAYADEGQLKTTLLEGLVKVKSGNNSSVIKPGEQAAINGLQEISIEKGVDTEEAVAWKNGLFMFENTDIKSVMRQIGRWYNVEVIFEEDVPQKKFTGKIYRNVNASEVFKVLEVLEIHFKLEGEKVIVTK